MTKIIIEESITSTIKTGVGQHTKMLNSLLPELDIEYEIVSNKFVESIKNATLKRIFYLLWLNSVFFIKLLFQKKDTVVLYTSFLPIIKLKKLKQIGIIHDVCIKVYPQQLSFLNRLNQNILNNFIIKKADRILTVSNTVKDEIIKYYNVSEDKIFTVYNSFSLNSSIIQDEIGILEKYGLNKEDKYFISSSSLNPNKNIKCLVEAFNIFNKKYPDYKLVLTGGKKHIINQYLAVSDNPNIIFTGFVNSEELIALYKNAQCYIFPSLYEGFGIPIIDAQLLELPVICSDIPVFREIASNSAIFSQISPEDFSNNMEKLIKDSINAESLVKLGSVNIERFSKENTKLQILNLIGIK